MSQPHRFFICSSPRGGSTAFIGFRMDCGTPHFVRGCHTTSQVTPLPFILYIMSSLQCKFSFSLTFAVYFLQYPCMKSCSLLIKDLKSNPATGTVQKTSGELLSWDKKSGGQNRCLVPERKNMLT